MEEVDTIVLNTPNLQEDGLLAVLAELGIEHHLAGDCLSPRTAEEAVNSGAYRMPAVVIIRTSGRGEFISGEDKRPSG
jgi:hypothetical protein